MLLEKITGGPSGPLAIIYFFQKKSYIGQKTPLNNKGLIVTVNKGPRLSTSWESKFG